jgi:DNA-directed RNA polymerase specialized sigma24 family protein
MKPHWELVGVVVRQYVFDTLRTVADNQPLVPSEYGQSIHSHRTLQKANKALVEAYLYDALWIRQIPMSEAAAMLSVTVNRVHQRASMIRRRMMHPTNIDRFPNHDQPLRRLATSKPSIP